tara:strand:+ start:49641 stop:49844 length:204 start_codon:yes stop_codon:yes gene_type:complete
LRRRWGSVHLSIHITASFGVASYPTALANDLNDLLKAADIRSKSGWAKLRDASKSGTTERADSLGAA